MCDRVAAAKLGSPCSMWHDSRPCKRPPLVSAVLLTGKAMRACANLRAACEQYLSRERSMPSKLNDSQINSWSAGTCQKMCIQLHMLPESMPLCHTELA